MKEGLASPSSQNFKWLQNWYNQLVLIVVDTNVFIGPSGAGLSPQITLTRPVSRLKSSGWIVSLRADTASRSTALRSLS